MNKSYTIFGHTGFVGQNLSLYLEKLNKKKFLPKRNKYKFNKNLNNIIYAIGNDDALKDSSKSIDANIKIISEIICNNKFKSFTLLSTTRLYLNSKNTSENTLIKINPHKKNNYFNSLKLTAENFCLSQENNKIKIIRLSNLFGNFFENQKFLLPTLIRDSLVKNEIKILINKNSKKNYLYIDDAINVILKIVDKSKYRIYNVASESNIKIGKIAKKIKKITNCKIKYLNQSIKIDEPKININRIKKEFKFKSTCKIEDKIESILHNYKKK